MRKLEKSELKRVYGAGHDAGRNGKSADNHHTNGNGTSDTDYHTNGSVTL